MTLLVAEATDYETLRHGCGLVDRSELGKLALSGAEAKLFLAGQVTNDIEVLTPGQGCYALVLTNKGKISAELRVLDVATTAGEELLLVCPRPALQGVFDIVRRGMIGWKCELDKRTVQQALFSLIGPQARTVAGADGAGLSDAEHANAIAQLGGEDVVLVATDMGVDVICVAESAAAVSAALLDAGAVAIAHEAAEVLRVESGRPSLGPDLDETVIPQEAGLNERAVSFTKGCYVGQETVARLYYRGKPNRTLRGLRLSADASTGDSLKLGEREVGRLGSVARSPEYGPIALALVRREAADGDVVKVGDGDVTATLVELPFS
jgi:folate-binding protein YgfZ